MTEGSRDGTLGSVSATQGRSPATIGRLVGPLRRSVRLLRGLFPFTTLGIGVAALAIVGLRTLAYGQLDLVVLVAAYAALGLLALSTLLVLPVAALDLRWLARMSRRPVERLGGEAAAQPPRWVEAGRPAPSARSLPALRWLPLVRLRLRWSAPAEAHAEGRPWRGRLEEWVLFTRRGRFETVERELTVEDPFGLVRIELRRHGELRLRVLPALGALRRVPLLRSMSGGEEWPHPLGLESGDRLELRRYAPGDPARFIHWRVFARTRKLVVRVPERALSRAQRTVAYLVAGDGDEASAAAARAVLESGALGPDWSFGCDGGGGAMERLTDALDAICESARHRHRGGEGLARFLREAERRGPASLVLFCPHRPGPWLARVREVLSARGLPAHVVVGIDGRGAVVKNTSSRWRRLLLRQMPDPERAPWQQPPPAFAELQQVVAALEAARATVLVVDRPTGRLLQQGHARLDAIAPANGPSRRAA